MEQHFDIAGFLAERRTPILDRANAEVAARKLPHYEAAGAAEVASRLATLFDVVVQAASEKHLDPALSHAEIIAHDRHQSGHDLHQVQRAINALEEQLWQAVIDDAPKDEQGYSLGVVSTILGAVKDRLACEYVTHSTAKPMHTLRIDALFEGTETGGI